MRKWFTYIKESFNDRFPQGHVMIFDKPMGSTTKGEELALEHYDIEKNEFFVPCKTVGLGYNDFKDEEDYKNRVVEVVNRKLKEVGIEE